MSVTNKQRRAFLPVNWGKAGFAAGQSTGETMAINGFPAGIVEMVLARQTSLVSVGIILSEALTAGLLRFEITKNGSATGKTCDMTSADGTKQLREFDPGVLVGQKGDSIGLQWGSSPTLAPNGTIDGVIFFEVQDG